MNIELNKIYKVTVQNFGGEVDLVIPKAMLDAYLLNDEGHATVYFTEVGGNKDFKYPLAWVRLEEVQ